MAKPAKSRFWRTCRIYFRRFRITVWLLLLLLLGSLMYLNQVGLPNFVKTPLLQKLHAHGIDLQFSRLRLRWYQGIVAENVRFGRAGEPLTPSLSLAEVKVSLDARALTRFKLQVDSLSLRRGQFIWPVAESNEPPQRLSIENIRTELRLLPNDQWALDHFTADFAGAKIHMSGVLTNASAVRGWNFFRLNELRHPGRCKSGFDN